MSFSLLKVALQGFSDAGAYDTYRPSYPPEAVEALLRKLNIVDKPHAKIVEIASGTGKFTQLLAARPEDYDVRAIEPHKLMREEMVKKGIRNVEVMDGYAAAMPVENGWGDAAFAAQAFHWFATLESLREIHRVLKPGAGFGMIWNVEEYNQPKDWPFSVQGGWEQKVNDLNHSLDDGHPRFRHQKWMEPFENQVRGNPLLALKDGITNEMPYFSLPLGTQKFPWTEWVSEDALWERFNTLSHINVLQGEARNKAIETFKKGLEGGGVERNDKGQVAVHGRTLIVWTARM